MSTLAEPADCASCVSNLCRFAQTEGPGRPGRLHRLDRGGRIGACSGPCVRFWTVLSGTAAICHTLQDGRRQIASIERAGSTIGGPMAQDTSPIWLEALEPSVVCEIDLSSGFAALRDDPAFLKVMFGLVHARLEATTRHVTALGRLDAAERVTLFLAETAALVPAGEPVHLPLSREDIAGFLGLKAETVSRVFSRLKKDGLFRFLSPTAYEVPDPDALAHRLPLPLPRRPRAPLAAAPAGDGPGAASRKGGGAAPQGADRA